MAHGGELAFLSDSETIKTKGREGKGMKNKKGFLSIHIVPPSIIVLCFKELIESYNFNTTEAD